MIISVSIALVVTLAVFSRVAFAKPEDAQRTEEYCMVMATSNLLEAKVTISLDKGQEVKLFRNTGAVKDGEGWLKKVNTVVDALNDINEDGWIFVDAYTVTVGQQNVYHYMMKRSVTPKE